MIFKELSERQRAIRQEVKAEIIKVMIEAKAQCQDEMSAARRTFPSVPESVLWECSYRLDEMDEETWWNSVERTIDGELIKNAIGRAGE